MKQLIITEEILKRIKAATGADIDGDTIAVFETITLNTKPISKKGSIYHEAVTSEGILYEMAALLQTGEAIQLLTMHNSYMIPIGTVFYGENVVLESGSSELRTQFYLPKTEIDLISKIDSGVLREVSVSFTSKKALCSHCDFDYMAPGNETNVWMRTCDDDHVIGIDGCHLNLFGLDRWYELSLVGKGAADHAQIVAPSEAVLSENALGERFAANGLSPYVAVCTTNFNDEEDSDMKMEDMVTNLAETKAANIVGAAKIVELEAGLATKTAKVTELEATVTTLEGEDKSKEITDLKENVTSLEGDVALAVTALTELTTAAQTKLGKPDAEIPTGITELTEMFKTSQVELSKLPVGGVGDGAGDGDGKKSSVVNLSAFKRNV